MWTIGLIVLVVAFGLVDVNSNYCAIPKCKTAHLACNETTIMSPDCPGSAGYVPIGHLKDYIVEFHNRLRNSVAGQWRAARMATMSWNNELEFFASLITATCSIFNEKCRRTEQFAHPGLNAVIFSYSGDSARYSSKKIIAKRLRKWADEHKHITDETFLQRYVPSNKLNVTVSHYAVMVAEGNTRVGCSAAHFDDGNINNLIFVCVYAITNRAGRPVYTTANEAASKCKTGPNFRYPNLCKSREKYRT